MIYIGKCSCEEEYIGETERNVEKRGSEHKNPTEKNEPGKDTCQVTSVTCLREKFWCLLQKTNEQVRN